MNQFLYQIQPTRSEMLSQGPTPRETEIINAHFAYLEELVEKETVLMAGRTLLANDEAFGIVVFAADSESAAKELMDNDPAVKNGVMKARLFPFRVALWSPNGPAK